MIRTTSAPRRWALSVLCLFLVLLGASSALAAGRTEWKSKTVKEREDKSWRLEVAIYLPRAPDVAHVPMKFEFLPTVYYERNMVDGDKIEERKVPLENRQELIESVDVGFLDSGSGKIESRTRFSFKLTRAHGYEAGEYKVTIRDTRDGKTIGAPTTLVFQGENEVIDRRAMVFGGEKKKEAKKEEPKAESSEAEKPAAEEEPAPAAESDEKSPEPAAEEDPPQTIENKPGGCGCRIQDQTNGSSAGAALAAAGMLVFALRRRRRS